MFGFVDKVLHYNQQGFVTGNKIVCSLVSITENWGIRFQLFAYGCLVVVCGTSSQTFGLNQY